MTAAASRPGPSTVLTGIGACCVVLGGLVAAVTNPLDLSRGSWLAGYLVLVAGVAQYAMGQARSYGPSVGRPDRWGWTQIGCWNAGNATVIGGTLSAQPLAVDLGSVLLVVALVIALHDARPARPVGQMSPRFVWAYRVMLVVLVVSIPVGMLLSHVRHSWLGGR